MPRFKITIEYDGSRYNGWQKQPQGSTIEGEIESALEKILQHPINIVGQGRTDSGVHAEAQVAHFDFSEPLEKHWLLFALLGVLPKDISVWDLEHVDDDFHARFQATARQYRYQIIRRASPLWRNRAEMVLGDLDMDAVHACAEMVPGEHNFIAFTKESEDQSDTTCTVHHSVFEERNHLLIYRIRANRFVRHMVRRLVGTMIAAGKGKISEDDFKSLLNATKKGAKGQGIRAKGLFLERVFYC